MSKWKCPSCGVEKAKGDIEGLRQSWIIGWEYDCSDCGARISHGVRRTSLFLLSTCLIIVSNFLRDTLISVHIFLPVTIVVVAAIIMLIAFRTPVARQVGSA